MGNCIETSKLSPETEVIISQHDQEHEEAKPQSVTEGKRENMKIKIVLTKEELQWLMFQLENSEGQGVEDVLGEIQRNRGKSAAALVVSCVSAATWKPSLDSITESPEEMAQTMQR